MKYKHAVDNCVDKILDYIEEADKHHYDLFIRKYDLSNIVSQVVEEAAEEAVEAYASLVQGGINND